MAVVLPAPGGAQSTTFLCFFKASMSLSVTSYMGRSDFTVHSLSNKACTPTKCSHDEAFKTKNLACLYILKFKGKL